MRFAPRKSSISKHVVSILPIHSRILLEGGTAFSRERSALERFENNKCWTARVLIEIHKRAATATMPTTTLHRFGDVVVVVVESGLSTASRSL